MMMRGKHLLLAIMIVGMSMFVTVPGAAQANGETTISLRVDRSTRLVFEQRERYAWSEGYRPVLLVGRKRHPMRIETWDEKLRRIAFERPAIVQISGDPVYRARGAILKASSRIGPEDFISSVYRVDVRARTLRLRSVTVTKLDFDSGLETVTFRWRAK